MDEPTIYLMQGWGLTKMRGGRMFRWNGLGTARRRTILLLGAVQVGLLAAALLDLRGRPAAELTAPKSVWFAACFVNFVGPLAYFAFGRRRSDRSVSS